ncbi:MAG: ABC transporter permease [Gemmatimonadota bacterium]
MSRPSLTRFAAIARKEILQLRRDRRSLIMAFGLPIVLVVIFGFAISYDVNDIPLSVEDRDRTETSRALLDAFRASGYFEVVRVTERTRDGTALLDRGLARIHLVIPQGFTADLRGRAAPVLQALVDGSDANTATIALNYADGIVQGFRGRMLTGGRLPEPPVSAEVRVWYNESLASRNMIVPGLIAVIMAIVAAMLTSLTIAREWERGTMEQLASTPVSRLEVVAGKLAPYLAIGLLDVLIAAALGIVVFHVPFRGSLLFLLIASLLFLLACCGLGLFISAALRSQLLAMQVSLLATYLPSFLLSGFAFDIVNMPWPLRALSAAVPARYFVPIAKGVFLKGVGLAVLWPELLALAGFAAAGVALAARAFHKDLAS